MWQLTLSFLLGAVLTITALYLSSERRGRRVRRTRDGLASGANSREPIREHTLALINGRVVADSRRPSLFSRLFARSTST